MSLRILPSITRVDAAQWNALAGPDMPFLRHEFLAALERHGAVGGESGWHPRYLVREESGALTGALPMFLKDHSFGEFVFDWAWAAAYERMGRPYYPKLVIAVPYTPVTGPRILSRDAAGADILTEAALRHAADTGVSSLHFLFSVTEERATLEHHGLLARTGCQFHWYNRGYSDFEDFLARFSAHHRKNVRAERRQVREQGLEVEFVRGDAADPALWDRFHRFYLDTFEKKGNYAPLSRGFFREIGAELGDSTLLILARDAGEVVAGALFFQGGDTLYGRHWGSVGGYRHLHFELCYYAAIEYCIAHGLRRFEAGAQGEYKIRRGFEPTPTHSLHWIAEPEFRAAIADFLAREGLAMENYLHEMRGQLPFKYPG
ncbi:MAG: N-acetyltransferase [Gammaproteobacteria bacterium]|nr:N-acetyltransferase [Gammaproteobacteria bacterium]